MGELDLLEEYVPEGSSPLVFENQQVGDVRKAAQILGVSTRTVYRLTKSGALPYRKVGNQIRFLLPQLIEWLKGEK